MIQLLGFVMQGVALGKLTPSEDFHGKLALIQTRVLDILCGCALYGIA
jgi:hypothetical protein